MNRSKALDALREAVAALESGDEGACLIAMSKARVALMLNLRPSPAIPTPCGEREVAAHWQDDNEEGD